MQVRLFRELFLTQFRLFAKMPNSFANDFLMSQYSSHVSLGKHFETKSYTVHSPLF